MQNLLQKNTVKTETVIQSVAAAKPTRTPRTSVNILDSKYARLKQSPQPEISKKLPIQIPKKISLPQTHLPGHLHLFFVSLVGYAAILYILLRVNPSSLQNVAVTNSYLPLLIIFLISNFCFFSFLFANTRRGLLISIILALYLFLRLQQVFSLPIAGAIAAPFVLYELIMSLLSFQRSK